MRDPWVLIALGALLIAVPLWLSRWDAGRGGKAGGVRDRVQTARSDPMAMNFFTGLRIGVELAGAILIGIGVLRLLGWAI